MIFRLRPRAGFTLIELLVVISIIVLLAALTMSGVSAVRHRQHVRNTDNILTKFQVGIDNQVKTLNNQARDEMRENGARFQALTVYCGGDPDRALALLMHAKVRQAFPQSFAEATATLNFGGVTFPPHKAYTSLAGLSGGTPEQQSAALLFAGLAKMGTGGSTFDMDDATSGSQMILNFNGATATAAKDAWGNPIAFRRFLEDPVLNASPFTNVRSALHDPFDTQGKLAGAWTNKVNAQSTLGGGIVFANNNKVVTPYSAGKDGVFGTGDDVFGFRLRQLGEQSK